MTEVAFRTYQPLKSPRGRATICAFASNFRSGPSLRAAAKLKRSASQSKKEATQPLCQLDQIAIEAKTDWLSALRLYEAGKLPSPDGFNGLPCWKLDRKASVIKVLHANAAKNS